MTANVRRPPRDPEGRMPVISHLRELRRRIIIILLVVAVGALVSYNFYNEILSVLVKPYCHVPLKYRERSVNGVYPPAPCGLVYNGVTDGFFSRLQISIIAGTVLSAPLWLYQVWAFVTPGLRKNERKYTITFVGLASVLFAAGMAIAYALLFPALTVLIRQSGDHTTPLLTIKPYLGFVTTLVLIFGAAFELPLLVVMLNLVGVLPYRWLRKWQRVAIFLIFLFAGVATPTPDPFTMCAMAVPMLLLFEGAVLFAYVHDKRKGRRQAVEAETELADNVASSVEPLPVRIDSNDWMSLP